tara:strand:- start:7782 stop:8438 length:657 start_codon:yes stop_codon:yes gene_type:complete
MPPKRCPPCPPCSSKAKAAPKKRAAPKQRKKAAPKKGVVVKKVGQKCPPSHPVGVIKHTSSGVPVKKHCRGNRGGAAASASTTGGGRVGQTKGKLSAAVLAGIGKAPAKKRAPRKAASKPLIMSFDQSGRITDAKGKIVKRAAREPAGGRFGERGVISVRTLKGDMGTKKGEPKKIKVKVPKRRVGQKKGALSAGIQASLARAREAKARKTNPSSGYA